MLKTLFTVGVLFCTGASWGQNLSCKSAKTGNYLRLIPRYGEIYWINQFGREIGYEDCINTHESKQLQARRVEFIRDYQTNEVALTLVVKESEIKAYYKGDVFGCNYVNW